jgi:hypothetical protein
VADSFNTSIKSRTKDFDAATMCSLDSLLELTVPLVRTSEASSRFRFADCMDGDVGGSGCKGGLKTPFVDAITRLENSCDVG